MEARAALVVVGAAVVLRVGYALGLFWFSDYEWLGQRHGADMQLAAVANLVVITVAVAAWVARMPRLAWLAWGAALATVAMPGAGAGFVSAQALPWVTATSAAAMLVTAARRGRADLIVAAAMLPVLAGVVVYREAWASLDYAVAGLAALLAGSAVMLLQSATTGSRAGMASSLDERRDGRGERI